jgi:putative heme-binding domain-containing protein
LNGPAERAEYVTQLLRVVGQTGDAAAVGRALAEVLPDGLKSANTRHFTAVAGLLDAVERRRMTLGADVAGRVAWVTQYAREIMRRHKERYEDKVAGLGLLCREPSQKVDIQLAGEFLDPKERPVLQLAAVAALARSRDPAAAVALVDAIPVASPGPRAKILDALTSRPAGMEALLAALESGKVAPVDLPAATRERMLAARDTALRERADKALATVRPAARAAAVRAYQPALSLRGDRAKGKAIFDKNCVACHNFEGAPSVGPDLAALTDKSSTYLLTAILDPNAAVEGRFVAYRLDTADGDTHIGLVASESASAVTLAQSGGIMQTVARTAIKSLTSTRLSLMPEGFEQGMSVQDVADLIAYVQAPR